MTNYSGLIQQRKMKQRYLRPIVQRMHLQSKGLCPFFFSLDCRYNAAFIIILFFILIIGCPFCYCADRARGFRRNDFTEAE